jgi:hypothetical protein
MNEQPPGLRVHDAPRYLMAKFKGRHRYPTYSQVLNRAYDGYFETVSDGRHRIIHDASISDFERCFGFGEQIDAERVEEAA